MKEKRPRKYHQLEGNWYIPSVKEARGAHESFVKSIISPYFYETLRDGVNIQSLASADALYENTPLQENIGALVMYTNAIEEIEVKQAGFSSNRELLTASLGWIAEVWASEIAQNPIQVNYFYNTAADRMVTQERNQYYIKNLLIIMKDEYVSKFPRYKHLSDGVLKIK